MLGLRLLGKPCQWYGLIFLGLIVAGGSALAQVQEYERLFGQFWRQYSAGDVPSMEQTAAAMRWQAEGPLRDDPRALPGALLAQGTVRMQQGRYADAEPLYRRAAELFAAGVGPDDPDVGRTLGSLGDLYSRWGRYAQSEREHRQALAVLEKAGGAESSDVGMELGNLASLFQLQGRYQEAEPLYERAIRIREAAGGAADISLLKYRNNLALLYQTIGRYAAAETLYRELLETIRATWGAEHPEAATMIANLAALYDAQGRYADAVPLTRQALTLKEKVYGRSHPTVALSLNNLGKLYTEQLRYPEAETAFQQALTIWRETQGGEHPEVPTVLSNLGNVYVGQGRWALAEETFQQALAARQKHLGSRHPGVGADLNNLQLVYYYQQQYARAIPLCRRAAAIFEEALGPEHPLLATAIGNLGLACLEDSQLDEAQRQLDRAIAIQRRAGSEPGAKSIVYEQRARLAWRQDQRPEALRQLREAMRLIEQQRSQGYGAEQQRAQLFGRYLSTYEQMLAWQTELRDVAEALAAMERSKARTMLEQMATQGVDLLQGIAADQADTLRQRQQEAQTLLASVDKQLQALETRTDVTAEERDVVREKLREQLGQAREQYAEVYADIRNVSPACRLAAGQQHRWVALDQLQGWVQREETLLLEYYVGVQGSYVLMVPPRGAATVAKLTIAPADARLLNAQPGIITLATLTPILGNQQGSGLLQQLRAPSAAETPAATARLGALWRCLLPEAARKTIETGACKRLLIVPDAGISNLPFETLVVGEGKRPRYLLDLDVPVAYAPSATILLNLVERPTASAAAGTTEPVLTLGDAQYEIEPSNGAGAPAARPSARSRYGTAGGKLSALPFTAWETTWVANVFGEKGIEVAQLRGKLATEAILRHNVAGRRVLHLACHGLVDQAYGNLFGALALTPGPTPDDPADDGFLTLGEVYALNLRGCELTLLSACDTNYGPQQRGEGAWAMSRGFLVAGARRVVASSWLVDDEAAATLVSYFCDGLASAEKKGGPLDYAAALQSAKRAVRQQEKWSHPYYWGTFVLVGPN